MKANSYVRSAALVLVLGPAALIAGCVPQRPAPGPVPTTMHTPRPTASSPAPAPVAPPANWLDAPASAGDWNWRKTPGGSESTFAGGQFTMQCDAARRIVTLQRTVPGGGGQRAMTIATSDASRVLAALPSERGVAATLAASDPLLDAMAFSRGRFAVQVAGAQPLYIPSWTEVSRVIEDCR